MFNRKTRIAMIAGIAAFALLAGLWQSNASAQCCGVAPAVTTFARPYSANRISWTSAYGVSSSCNPWVPGSCGYSVYRPVTAYSPVVQTAYSPVAPVGSNCVTALQTRQVPGQPIRNLFRILLPPYRPVPVTTCYTPTTACYSGTCTSYSPLSCSSCTTCVPSAGSSCAPACSASCPPSYNACSSYSSVGSPCASGACDSANVTPTYYNGPAPSSNNDVPSTYREESNSNTELRLMPTPDSTTGAKMKREKLVDRDDRTAMQPIRQAVLYRPVSLTGSSTPSTTTVDVGGWRASSN